MKTPIWFDENLHLSDIRSIEAGTMAEHLGMQWVEVGNDFLKMRMPVDSRTKQPYGLLHGGASCALAETAGSLASHFIIDPEKNICVGLEINANHIRSVKEGWVTAIVTPLHIGLSTHVWDIKIHNEAGRLICVCRLTVAILRRGVEDVEKLNIVEKV